MSSFHVASRVCTVDSLPDVDDEERVKKDGTKLKEGDEEEAEKKEEERKYVVLNSFYSHAR